MHRRHITCKRLRYHNLIYTCIGIFNLTISIRQHTIIFLFSNPKGLDIHVYWLICRTQLKRLQHVGKTNNARKRKSKEKADGISTLNILSSDFKSHTELESHNFHIMSYFTSPFKQNNQ